MDTATVFNTFQTVQCRSAETGTVQAPQLGELQIDTHWTSNRSALHRWGTSWCGWRPVQPWLGVKFSSQDIGVECFIMVGFKIFKSRRWYWRPAEHVRNASLKFESLNIFNFQTCSAGLQRHAMAFRLNHFRFRIHDVESDLYSRQYEHLNRLLRLLLKLHTQLLSDMTSCWSQFSSKT